jgi:glycosyltransferase involved in cell wall biosynthesis
MPKICVIIPTHNESTAIAGVVTAVKKQGLDVVVIDDGSTDGTAGLAKSCGATVLVNETNMGKGTCLIKGFAWCLKNGYDAVITMDGDGQHLPGEIAAFTAAFAANPRCGIIIGNRMATRGAMPLVRVITNKIMSRWISHICRQRIPDTQCGYRLIRRETLEKMKLKTSKFEIESEMLIESSRLGFSITSIPVTSIYHNEQSHINPFIDTIRFLRFILKK